MRLEPDTILIAEDDPNDALLVQRAFRTARLANPIQVVGDGERAIAYISGVPPYDDREKYPMPMLVLLDLKMPRKGGHEVLEWIRAQPGIKRLPVVVLTSSSEMIDINRAYDLGANSYLVKPVEFEALLEMVKELNLYWAVMNKLGSVQE
ncbi:MAG: response regulator [Actinomycetota bacterium]